MPFVAKIKHCLIAVLLALLFSCNNNPLHINHAVYKVKPSETIEIYTTTNSCCHYCEPDNKAFHAIRFEKRAMVEEAPEGCDGCSYTEGWKFKALNPGTDTILLEKMTGAADCMGVPDIVEKYIVVVDEP